MSTRKSTAFYIVLTAVASLAVGMVIAARLDLVPASSAQTVNVPVANNAPLAGPIDATTFRNIAKYNAGAVVNIQTEVRQRGFRPRRDRCTVRERRVGIAADCLETRSRLEKIGGLGARRHFSGFECQQRPAT